MNCWKPEVNGVSGLSQFWHQEVTDFLFIKRFGVYTNAYQREEKTAQSLQIDELSITSVLRL